MDHIILQSLQGTATAAEELELRRWRAASAANEAHYTEIRRVWELAGIGADTVMPGPVPDARTVVRRAEHLEGGAGSGLAVRMTSGPWWVRAAAVAALVALGTALAELRPDNRRELGFGADEFVTGAGETATVRLRDGTVVRLAPSSRLRLTGTLQQREAMLAGRGYFAVAPRDGSQFRIRTAAGDVVVLGTRFDLATHGEDMHLLVVEGRVAVSAGGSSVEVGGGEVGRVWQGTVLPVVQVAGIDSLIAWKGSFLAFQATPLEAAAREIERLYDVRIEIADDALAARTITTWFTDRSLDEVLRIVCAVAAAECGVDDGVVTMVPSPRLQLR